MRRRRAGRAARVPKGMSVFSTSSSTLRTSAASTSSAAMALAAQIPHWIDLAALLHSLPMAAPPPAAAATPGELPKLNDKVEKLIDELVHNLRRRYGHLTNRGTLTFHPGRLPARQS